MREIKNDEKLNVLNHSCAHLLAHAVKHLYPDAKYWVGPVIESGFYYDIDLGDVTLTEEDLPKIEKEMKKCSKMLRILLDMKLVKMKHLKCLRMILIRLI
jgi:threonyl-tRNA synthetase